VAPTPSEPKQYVIGRIQEALAHDPRAGELDVQVKVVGEKVFLSGSVATPERHDAVSRVVAELLPDHDVHNELVVIECQEDPAPERLS
jgi:osmotically-inducible protein OsmY